jgi:hypothetical protein
VLGFEPIGAGDRATLLADRRSRLRQIMQGDGTTPKRYLVIAGGTPAQIGEPVQVQVQP